MGWPLPTQQSSLPPATRVQLLAAPLQGRPNPALPKRFLILQAAVSFYSFARTLSSQRAHTHVTSPWRVVAVMIKHVSLTSCEDKPYIVSLRTELPLKNRQQSHAPSLAALTAAHHANPPSPLSLPSVSNLFFRPCRCERGRHQARHGASTS